MQELIFDTSSKEYYITMEALINNRGVSEQEMFDAFKNPDIVLKDFSRTIYRYIYNFYRGEDKARHRMEIQTILETDSFARESLKRAIIEYAMGALISELDLNKYLAEGPHHLPDSVHQELMVSELLRRRTSEKTQSF